MHLIINMKRTFVWSLLLIVLVLNCFAGASAAKPKVVDDGTLIENVTVISPERSAPLAHAVVVVRDGRIAEVGTDLVAGAHAKQIDGRRGFLIPGLFTNRTKQKIGRLISIRKITRPLARSIVSPTLARFA